MEVMSYLLEDQAELEACLSAIEPEELVCHSLLVEIFGVSLGMPELSHTAHLVRERFPQARVVGGAVDAIISGGRGSSSGISLTFVKFDCSEVEFHAMPLDELENPIGYQKCLAWLDGLQDLSALQVLTIGHINAISSLFRDKMTVPVFGGLLGDSVGGRQGFIYGDGEVVTHGLFLIAFCGKSLKVKVERSSGWKPLGPMMKVTKLDGPYIIKELDGQPFEEVYTHYIGNVEGETFLDKSLLFPIILHRDGELLSRHPLACHEDGSAEFGAGFLEGDDVQFGYGDPAKIIYKTQQMQQKIAEFQPQAMFLSDCLARWLLLEGKVEGELKNCRHIAPSFGFYGYGELMNLKNNLSLANMTLVLAAMKEENTEETRLFEFQPDKIALTRHQQFLSHLVHFVETTTSELEALNVLLGNKAKTDALTGLYNKGQIESLLAEILHQELKNPRGFCIVMIDLDNFKGINDRFGHDEGDVTLKTLAQVLSEQVRGTDAAGRWGGDEFMLLLRETDGSGAMHVAERIKAGVAEHTLPDGSHFTLSIGIAMAVHGDTQATLFKRADEALYQAKNTPGKNAVAIR